MVCDAWCDAWCVMHGVVQGIELKMGDSVQWTQCDADIPEGEVCRLSEVISGRGMSDANLYPKHIVLIVMSCHCRHCHVTSMPSLAWHCRHWLVIVVIGSSLPSSQWEVGQIMAWKAYLLPEL